MDMMLNGKPADISDFEADELAASVLISLFHGANPFRTMALKLLTVRVGGETRSRRLLVIGLARASGCYSGRRFCRLRVDVTASREGVEGIVLQVVCYRPDDKPALQARFQNVWE